MDAIFNKLNFYSSLLEMVKIIVLRIDNEPKTYFLVPYALSELNHYSQEIGNHFSYLLPKEITVEGLKGLELNRISEIEFDNSTFSFELITGTTFNDKFISKS